MGTITIALDANFGLVRKSNAGRSVGEPQSSNTGFFVNNIEVDEFVTNYQDDKKSDKVNYFVKYVFIAHIHS